MPPLSVGFVSLGCAKNLVDSEHMATALRRAGVALARSPDEADVVLVNTCGFIGDAKEESLDAVFEACARKRRGLCRAVVVTGCLIQRYRRELPDLLPEVDAFVGLDELEEVGRVVRALEAGEKRVVAVGEHPRRVFEPGADRVLLSGGPFAYLKIAEGCNHRCAFCAIPMIRGPYRSRPVASVVREAERLLERGVRELNLISQDTTRYGHDLGGRATLPNLLRALGRLGGRFWVRLLYGHPAHVSDELLTTMGEVPQVCRYLDLPVQHSHPAVLRAMGRGGSAAAVRDLPVRLRAALPGVALRTTCLVGYPGETEAQFEALCRYVREARFDHLGVFGYSREEGTPAHGLRPQRRARTIGGRVDRLMRLQRRVVRQHGLERVGQEDTVLLEERAAQAGWVGRAASQAPEVDGVVQVAGVPAAARAGQFVRVRYTAPDGYDLRAVWCGSDEGRGTEPTPGVGRSGER
jgi:ribosomal protein S12 methylthiotransferase